MAPIPGNLTEAGRRLQEDYGIMPSEEQLADALEMVGRR
jgi:hypothetical protein